MPIRLFSTNSNAIHYMILYRPSKRNGSYSKQFLRKKLLGRVLFLLGILLLNVLIIKVSPHSYLRTKKSVIFSLIKVEHLFSFLYKQSRNCKNCKSKEERLKKKKLFLEHKIGKTKTAKKAFI